jgi:plastocyanin
MRCGRRIVQLCACIVVSANLFAADIEVTVVDVNGEPVAGVVVYAESSAGPPSVPVSTSAVMDQIDARFVPHILVVQTGTSVSFPNSDFVAHHVYSFSTPNQFVLPLYKGNLHDPVTFDESGVVTLGCNIHDEMLGYILVIDSATFVTTDVAGKATLTVDNPDGYSVRIWSPRFRQGDVQQQESVAAEKSANITFSLTQKLHEPHEAGSTALAWKDY